MSRPQGYREQIAGTAWVAAFHRRMQRPSLPLPADVLAAPVNYQPFQVTRVRPGFFPAAAGRWRRDLPGRCQRRVSP
jgi:hypothetical protein